MGHAGSRMPKITGKAADSRAGDCDDGKSKLKQELLNEVALSVFKYHSWPPLPEHHNLEVSNAIIRHATENRFISRRASTMPEDREQVSNPGQLYRLPNELLLIIMEYCIGHPARRWLIMNLRRDVDTSIAIFSVCRKFRFLAQQYILPNIVWGFDFKYELLAKSLKRTQTPEKCLMESALAHPYPDPEKFLIHTKVQTLEQDYISREIAVRLKPRNLPLQPRPIRQTVEITWKSVRSQPSSTWSNMSPWVKREPWVLVAGADDGMEPNFSRTIDCGRDMSQLHSRLQNARLTNCSIWDVDVTFPSAFLGWHEAELSWADNVIIIPQCLGWMIYNFRNFTAGFEQVAILKRFYRLLIQIPPHPDGKTVRCVIIRSESNSQPQAIKGLQDVNRFTKLLFGLLSAQDPNIRPWFRGAQNVFCLMETPIYMELRNRLNSNWRFDFQV